ncbi:unnamed protein product [Camellia sinensis]
MASTAAASTDHHLDTNGSSNPPANAPHSTATTTSSSAAAADTMEVEAAATDNNPPPPPDLAPATTVSAEKKWPGWPGSCVFRLIVPVLKVGSIIGRKGDLIKKMCEETRARIRVLDGPVGSPDRICYWAELYWFLLVVDGSAVECYGVQGGDANDVKCKAMIVISQIGEKERELECIKKSWTKVLISGKEELESPLSPAMDAVIRVFKRVNGLPESEGDVKVPGAAFCSIRFLVASTQAINLIGKQGSSIKSIQESTGASIRVLSSDEVPHYANSEERIVEMQGESLKVLKAVEAVVGHLRKFLVDQSVLPLFEKSVSPVTLKVYEVIDYGTGNLLLFCLFLQYNTPASQERQVETWAEKSLLHSTSQTGMGADYPLAAKRDPLFHDRETQFESNIHSSGISLYGQDPGLSGMRSSGLGRAGGPFVTQIAQTMQIPLSYAEDIIGIGGANIAYIRRTSGAILSVQESRGLPDEITVEIKGTSSQVQTAQQLIQEFISSHKEPASSSYGKIDTGLRSSYSQLGNTTAYPSSSLSTQPYGGYGSSGLGGYSSFRL